MAHPFRRHVASPSTSSRARHRAAPEVAITANGLRKHFGDHTAVAEVTFDVEKGSILALLGPNGAGKTTTVNMLCTLLKPDAGSAIVAGHDVVADAAAVRRSIMLTGQFAALDESLSGRANLVLFGRLMGLTRRAARERADELLTDFGLTDAAERRVGKYSGGMRRRIDIACGLVTRPEVVFLDEPTTGLDPRSRQDVWRLVSALRDQGVTILLTTQYLEEADLLSDRIIVIDKGTVIAEGTADQLKERTGGTYCEIVPRQLSDIPEVARILGPLLPDAHRAALSDTSDRISMPAPDGPGTLMQALHLLSEANIDLTDIALRRPSLDEVFLALTGDHPKAIEDDDELSAADAGAYA